MHGDTERHAAPAPRSTWTILFVQSLARCCARANTRSHTYRVRPRAVRPPRPDTPGGDEFYRFTAYTAEPERWLRRMQKSPDGDWSYRSCFRYRWSRGPSPPKAGSCWPRSAVRAGSSTGPRRATRRQRNAVHPASHTAAAPSPFGPRSALDRQSEPVVSKHPADRVELAETLAAVSLWKPAARQTENAKRASISKAEQG